METNKEGIRNMVSAIEKAKEEVRKLQDKVRQEEYELVKQLVYGKEVDFLSINYQRLNRWLYR